MSDQPGINLVKFKIEKRKEGKSPKEPGSWAAAAKAYAAGSQPEKRFPVIISADNILPTPESLKEFL